MAACLETDPIKFSPLTDREIPLRPARGNRFTGEWTRPNASTRKFGKSRLRLLSISLVSAD
jgi:hypothetical protein